MNSPRTLLTLLEVRRKATLTRISCTLSQAIFDHPCRCSPAPFGHGPHCPECLQNSKVCGGKV